MKKIVIALMCLLAFSTHLYADKVVNFRNNLTITIPDDFKEQEKDNYAFYGVRNKSNVLYVKYIKDTSLETQKAAYSVFNLVEYRIQNVEKEPFYDLSKKSIKLFLTDDDDNNVVTYASRMPDGMLVMLMQYEDEQALDLFETIIDSQDPIKMSFLKRLGYIFSSAGVFIVILVFFMWLSSMIAGSSVYALLSPFAVVGYCSIFYWGDWAILLSLLFACLIINIMWVFLHS